MHIYITIRRNKNRLHFSIILPCFHFVHHFISDFSNKSINLFQYFTYPLKCKFIYTWVHRELFYFFLFLFNLVYNNIYLNKTASTIKEGNWCPERNTIIIAIPLFTNVLWKILRLLCKTRPSIVLLFLFFFDFSSFNIINAPSASITFTVLNSGTKEARKCEYLMDNIWLYMNAISWYK